MFYELSDFVRMIEHDDFEQYDQYKKQTLMVMELLDEAKKQRDER